VAALHLNYSFVVTERLEAVYALLSDVPASAAHFPRLQRLVPTGRGQYQWVMEPVGPPELHLQTVYACDYRCSKAQGRVAWTPVEGVGNARVSGSWTMRRRTRGTELCLDIQGDLKLPLPALMQTVVAPVIESEFEQRVDTYVDRLIAHFGGEIE
jgi:hypothetical protein